MRPIPAKHRKLIEEDDFYRTCCVCKTDQNIEIDHVWQHRGRQIAEMWSYVPLCTGCHRGNNGTLKPGVREKTKAISLKRLVDSGFENLTKYKKPMDNTWENRINYYL